MTAARQQWLTRVVGNAQNTPFCAASRPHPATAGLAQIGGYSLVTGTNGDHLG